MSEKKTKVIRVDASDPDRDVLEEAAKVLREGGLAAFPTETVYGLGALALSERAVEKIFVAKGRPATNPLIVHVASIEDARELASEWPQAAEELAQAFWPGPLTLVVKKSEKVGAAVCAGLDTVAIRIPAHPVARMLIELVGSPIAAPSANPYTKVSPTRAEHVLRGLAGRIDMVVDGGPTQVGVESSLVSVVSMPAQVLQPEMIGRVRLSKVVELAEGRELVVDDEIARASPGLSKHHYSPGPAVRLVERTEFLEILRSREVGGERVFIGIGVGGGENEDVHYLPGDPAGYGRGLYEAFHRFDRAEIEEIIVEKPGDAESDEWAAIFDRLRRASAI